ncbi:MAG: hypothetical protein ACE5KA_07540 [Nitrososphaerales archaeon]
MTSKCECGWELPKEVDLRAEGKEGVQKLRRLMVTVICPICNSPHYSTGDETEYKQKAVHEMYA